MKFQIFVIHWKISNLLQILMKENLKKEIKQRMSSSSFNQSQWWPCWKQTERNFRTPNIDFWIDVRDRHFDVYQYIVDCYEEIYEKNKRFKTIISFFALLAPVEEDNRVAEASAFEPFGFCGENYRQGIFSAKNASGRRRSCGTVSGRKQAKPSDDAYRVSVRGTI